MSYRFEFYEVSKYLARLLSNVNGVTARWSGAIDGYSQDEIRGWAYDRIRPGKCVTVEAVATNGDCSVAIANRYRSDLEVAGYGSGRHGFVVDIRAFDLQDTNITVYVANSKRAISREPLRFSEQPRSNMNARASSQRWIGCIDYYDDRIIRGWACDSHNLDHNVTVEFVASDGKRKMAVADLDRPDIRNAGFGHGNHGYMIDIRTLCLREESVTIRIAGTDVFLSPQPLEFDAQRAALTGEMPAAYTHAMAIVAEQIQIAAEQRNLPSGR